MKFILLFFIKFRDTIWGSPLQNAKDRLNLAARQYARRAADIAYHETMLRFYTEQLYGVDPHQRWWEFAVLKQFEKNEQDDLLLERRRLSQDDASRNAAEERLKAILAAKPQAPSWMPEDCSSRIQKGWRRFWG